MAHLDADSSNQEDLQEVDEQYRFALIQSVRSKEGADDFVRAVSSNLLLHGDCNWGQLLSAAPKALCSLGQCFVAATSSTAISAYELPKVEGLQHTSIRANLVHCSDLGRKAFMEAEKRMNKVTMVATYIGEANGTIDKILKCISNERLAKHDLQNQLDRLSKFSNNCVQDSQMVEQRFQEWLDLAMAIRRACTDADSKNDQEMQELEKSEGTRKWKLEVQKKDLKQAQETISDARDNVKIAQADFERSSKELPKGWNGLGMQIVGSFANVATSAAEGTASLLGLKWKYEKSVDDGGESKIPQEQADNAGYKLCASLLHFLDWLKWCLTNGPDGQPHYGVDWVRLYRLQDLRDRNATNDETYSIDTILDELRSYETQIKRHPNNTPTLSKVLEDALDILKRTIDIANSIENLRQQEKPYYNGSVRDPLTIVTWRKTIIAIHERCLSIKTAGELASKERRGTRSKTKISVGPGKREKLSVLKMSRENYQESRKALTEEKTRLQRYVEEEREYKAAFNETQLALAKLASEKVTMDEINSILQKCITNLTEFRNNLGELVRFFSGLHTLISTVDATNVQGFLSAVETGRSMAADSDGVDAQTLEDEKKYHMDSLMLDALKLRGHYAVAGEISATYVEVSQKHIIKGVNAIDALSSMSVEGASREDTKKKTVEITNYARKAQSAISALAEKRRQRLRQELFEEERRFEELGYMIEAAEEDADNVHDEWDEPEIVEEQDG